MAFNIFSRRKTSSQRESSPEPKKKEKRVETSATGERKTTEKVKAKVSGGENWREVIIHPHLSEKSTRLMGDNQYVFRVYKNANKSEIKKAVETIYKVKVAKVNIVRSPAPVRHFRNQRSTGERRKKAIVTLKKGYKIEF